MNSMHPGGGSPRDCVADRGDWILVTGSNGFIGAKVVETLLEYGFRNIRCFVRPSSRTDRLIAAVKRFSAEETVELCAGDLLSPEDCKRAVAGCTVVYHLAAGFDKSFAGAFMASALATRNLLDACVESGWVNRFVNVSSFAVYSNVSMRRGALLDENAPLEDAPQERFDAYAFGKLKQEELVREYGRTYGVRHVILRPGTVFGPGKKDLTGRIGVDTFGFFVHVGGRNRLPLTFVDNCAEAIVLAGLVRGIDGEIFNVVDDESRTSAQFLRAYKSQVGRFVSIRVPYAMAYLLCALWEAYSRRSRGQLPPAFNRRRCAAEWKGNRFSNQRLRDKLGWRPRVGMSEAMALFLGQFAQGEK
jgi:nucleoside-diphosphate-sugar epimerase